VIDPRTVPVRFSRLRAMARSPLHYLDACQDDRADTLSMRLGRGAHALVLGTPVVMFDGVRRGKEWDAFKAAHENVEILNGREFSEAAGLADAIRRHDLAASILLGADVVREQRLEWRWLGLDCAGTPDARTEHMVADLKTTVCSEPVKFIRDATRAGYHAQLAWYALGLEQLGMPRVDDLYVVAVENRRPYAVTVLRLSDEAREAGERLCRAWMERLIGCVENNYWPAYAEQLVPFDVEASEFSLIIDGEEIQP
jgi:hypothetical protein